MNLKIVFSIILFTFNFINVLANDASLLDKLIDYEELCDLHYNSNSTDQQLAKIVSSGTNFALNYETTLNNIDNFDEINKLRDKYFEEIYKNLEEANKDYIDNNLSVRGCSWTKYIACSVYTVGITACLSAILPPIIGACVAGMGTGAVFCYKNC